MDKSKPLKPPKPPAGRIEIEGVGIFDADNVPKYAYLQQKILMWLYIIAFPIALGSFWFSMFYLFD